MFFFYLWRKKLTILVMMSIKLLINTQYTYQFQYNFDGKGSFFNIYIKTFLKQIYQFVQLFKICLVSRYLWQCRLKLCYCYIYSSQFHACICSCYVKWKELSWAFGPIQEVHTIHLVDLAEKGILQPLVVQAVLVVVCV